jgi:hypothetical protein
MIWTGDHLDAARRLQTSLADPARTLSDRRAAGELRRVLSLRPAVASPAD